MKVFGAVEIYSSQFHYGFAEEKFNASTYLKFLKANIAPRYRKQGAILVLDNASYHKDATALEWYEENQDWLEVYFLPPYSPEFNPTENIWKHTRKNRTHNKYFHTVDELLSTLTHFFRYTKNHPETIANYMAPYCR